MFMRFQEFFLSEELFQLHQIPVIVGRTQLMKKVALLPAFHSFQASQTTVLVLHLSSIKVMRDIKRCTCSNNNDITGKNEFL